MWWKWCNFFCNIKWFLSIKKEPRNYNIGYFFYLISILIYVVQINYNLTKYILPETNFFGELRFCILTGRNEKFAKPPFCNLLTSFHIHEATIYHQWREYVGWLHIKYDTTLWSGPHFYCTWEISPHKLIFLI